jgi:hypothetical protein
VRSSVLACSPAGSVQSSAVATAHASAVNVPDHSDQPSARQALVWTSLRHCSPTATIARSQRVRRWTEPPLHSAGASSSPLQAASRRAAASAILVNVMGAP